MIEEKSELPAGYHMTELGPLPEEWRVVRLGEVAHSTLSGVHESPSTLSPALCHTQSYGLRKPLQLTAPGTRGIVRTLSII